VLQTVKKHMGGVDKKDTPVTNVPHRNRMNE
jgi:hypothetical protein